MPSLLGPRQQRSRDRILEAGAKLFVAYGLRRTSMEAIAAEAGVAKATAYAQFPNKEAVFDAAVAYLSDGMIARAEAAAGAAKAPAAAVLASLTSKQLEMFATVMRSPHAAELLAAFAGAGEKSTTAAHEAYQATLTRWLARCPRVGKRAASEVAELLDQSAWGIAARVRSEAELKTRLKLLIERVVG